MNKEYALYKLAGIRTSKRGSSRAISLMRILDRAAGKGKQALVSNLLNNINNFSKVTTLPDLKKQVRASDDLFDMSDISRKLRNDNNKEMHSSLAADITGLTSLKITAINKQLKLFGLSGIFNRDGLVAVINNKTGLIIPSLTFHGNIGNFWHHDLHPITHSLLSSKFGLIKVLPRSTVSHDSPSIYFGFAGDPKFNLKYYLKIKLDPNVPLNILYGNIGRVFNTRHHNMYGGLYDRFVGDTDRKSKRYYGQHIIAQAPLHSANLLDLVGSLNKLFIASGKSPIKLPSYMYGLNKTGMYNLTNFLDWY